SGAAPARLRPPGPVHADRDRAGSLGARCGDRAVIDLARIGGPVACLGLALLLLATTRRDRIAGLGFAAFGSCLLGAAIAPRLPLNKLGVRALYAELTLMGLVFSAIGFYQYDTRDIFQNPKVIFANAYAPFFRVNSVFWDPSVYGRFLVIAMLPSLVLIVRERSPRLALAAAAAVVVTWFGLLISFSQSSF